MKSSMPQELGNAMRTPPHSVEAEESVLGSVLLDNTALDLVLDTLSAEDFYREAHRQIFQAMKDLAAENMPVDPTTLLARLGNEQAVEAAGGAHYVFQLTNRVPSAINVRHYTQIVHEKALLRRVLALTEEAHESVYVGVENVQDFVDSLERQVFALAQTEGRQGITPIREVVKDAFRRLEALQERKEKVTGVTTGYADLDDMLAGFQPSDLVILAARPSMGKTALSLNFVAAAAIHARIPTVFFSLEMSKEQLAMRLLACEARIDQSRLRTGMLLQEEWLRLIETVGVVSDAPLYLDDTPALAVTKMQAIVRRLKAEHGIGLIVVDYLQLMKGDQRLQSREQVISDISRNLKAIAKELKVPVIALSQLNRGVDSRTDKRPMLSDLRESGAIEQDADVIMFIYRDEVYNKETKDRGIAEVIISKQRNGSIGTVRLKWFGQFTRFENLARDQGIGGPF